MNNDQLKDQWGQDPAVRTMRRVFARMETLQGELLGRLALSPLDERLRRARELARNLFERAWPMAQQKALVEDEEEIAALYLHCFARVLHWERINVPEESFREDKKITRFLSEHVS